MNPITSTIVTFVSGLAVGILGTFAAERLSDKARHRDSKKARQRQFKEFSLKMPRLFKEMRDDLKGSGEKLDREFYILSSKRVIHNLGNAAFVYYEEEHDSLNAQIRMLSNAGFIFEITETAVPKYQFEEEFVSLLLKD